MVQRTAFGRQPDEVGFEFLSQQAFTQGDLLEVAEIVNIIRPDVNMRTLRRVDRLPPVKPTRHRQKISRFGMFDPFRTFYGKAIPVDPVKVQMPFLRLAVAFYHPRPQPMHETQTLDPLPAQRCQFRKRNVHKKTSVFFRNHIPVVWYGKFFHNVNKYSTSTVFLQTADAPETEKIFVIIINPLNKNTIFHMSNMIIIIAKNNTWQ